jgi:hypothetical protein
MSHDIKSILERLSIVESKTVPVSPKGSMTKQQERVPQLPALFKPKDISPTLTKKPYQKHPMDGYMVGENSLAEAMQEVEEEMISKVRKNLASYLDQLGDKQVDDGSRDKRSTPELDKLTKKDRAYRDMIAKAVDAIEAAEEVEEMQDTCVETITMEDGSEIEIHGTDGDGFEIRRLGRALPTRFPNIDHARMAVDIFKNQRQMRAHDQDRDLDQDYIEEK